MDFYVVFVKNRKKLDKYIKINRIKSKTIIDIKQQLEEHGLEPGTEYKDYFNLLIYTKIVQTFRKGKDVYYIPNISRISSMDIDEILQMKDMLKERINFNLLFFFEDFKDNQKLNDVILSNITVFDAIQIIKDY